MALELGFAAVGIAEAGASRSVAEQRDWLRQGYAGEMKYLERHAPLKTSPENVAQGVRSIIAVAARYPTNPNPGRGFSTYARGQDYHDVIRKKLRELSEGIHKIQPLKLHRVCVDSAPLAEREWAMRAGIGWQGKQGQLVNPTVGCCMLLGFLLVDIALEPSQPLENRCGNCSLCLDACPTGAALGDAKVDARRCLSYLTIEPGAVATPELQKSFGGALFGCDCCTAVCPWNQKATAPIMPELQESAPLPDAAEIMRWNDEDFRQRFKGTPVFRTGLAHLQKNAELAVHHHNSKNESR